MLRRLAFGLVSLVVALAAGIALWIATHSSDLPAPEDSDLEVRLPEIGADENGFEYFKRAAARMAVTDRDEERVRAMLRGEERNPAWVRQLARANRGAFAELERAIEAPVIVLPEPRTVVETHDFDSAFTAWKLVRLAALDSQERVRRGDVEGALTTSRIGLRLAAALGRAHRPELVAGMLAVAFENLSLRALGDVVRAWHPDSRAALRLARELDSHRVAPSFWREVWSGEYQFVKGMHKKIRARDLLTPLDGNVGTAARVFGALPDGFLWQPNRTLTEITAPYYRSYAVAFSQPCRQGSPAFATLGDPRLVGKLLRGNALGVLLATVPTPNFDKFNTRRCHTETRISLLQTLVALEAYRSAEKTLPDSLDALVPRYLDRVPQDAFGGGPLRFDRARGLVSSLGSDFAPATTEGPPSPDDELEPATYVGAAASGR